MKCIIIFIYDTKQELDLQNNILERVEIFYYKIIIF